MRAFRNLRIILTALAVFAAAAVVGYRLIEGWSWLDSIYMVVMTITTIGYKEVHGLSHTGQIFNIVVMIVGVGLVFLSIGALTQGLLEFELGKFLGKRKMQRDIERLSEHYIICKRHYAKRGSKAPPDWSQPPPRTRLISTSC